MFYIRTSTGFLIFGPGGGKRILYESPKFPTKPYCRGTAEGGHPENYSPPIRAHETACAVPCGEHGVVLQIEFTNRSRNMTRRKNRSTNRSRNHRNRSTNRNRGRSIYRNRNRNLNRNGNRTRHMNPSRARAKPRHTPPSRSPRQTAGTPFE